ncbi:MAG TPA: hypothetical protein VLT79_12490, partial [Gemmatimonadales bacterium]|nr:hypothetical protein [Gemmatimonadales bacterium]
QRLMRPVVVVLVDERVEPRLQPQQRPRDLGRTADRPLMDVSASCQIDPTRRLRPLRGRSA